jgi:hypothetical protein
MDLPMTAPRSCPAPADWVPVEACTLPTAAQPLRAADFDDLFAAALCAVERPPAAATRVRLVLAGEEGLAERVQRLADAETACCSSFTLTLTPLDTDQASGADATAVALDIAVPAARADVLAGLIAHAEQARRVTA